tara:strand:+ start:281 stop:1246 length:966 start_codon:yes stop_codon:yes gene_type:complete
LDAGNLLFKKETLGPGSPTEIAKLTAETIINSFNKIGCNAFSPGSKDFAAGLNFVQEMQSLAKFPFISANIFDINGNRIFDPYTIIDVDGVSLGIIGLASIFTHSDIYIKNPLEAINELASEVNSQSDVIILLFDSQESDLSQIQQAKNEIDLIIRSKSKIRSQDGGTKNIPAYSCGDRGKYLYQFDLTIADPNKDFIDLALYENRKSQAEKKLNKMKQGNLMVDLYNTYKDDPESLKKIETYESQIKSANIALNNSVNTISIKKHELGKTITDRPDILKIVDKGKNKITKAFGPQPPPGTPTGNHKHIRHDHDGDGIPDH